MAPHQHRILFIMLGLPTEPLAVVQRTSGNISRQLALASANRVTTRTAVFLVVLCLSSSWVLVTVLRRGLVGTLVRVCILAASALFERLLTVRWLVERYCFFAVFLGLRPFFAVFLGFRAT